MATLFPAILFVYYNYNLYYKQPYVLRNLFLYLEVCKSADCSTLFYYREIII